MKHIPIGITVKGIVVSSRATARRRKDGSGIFVIAEHEIAAPPLVVCFEEFFDPERDPVELDGLEVRSFPAWSLFEEVALRVERFRLRGEMMVVTRGQRLLAIPEEE